MTAERFSASSAARHMACPASANLPLAIPNWQPPVEDPDAGAKAVGHRFHEIFASLAELGVKDLAAFAAAIQYLHEVRARRRFKVYSEVKMEASWLATRPTTTPDLVLFVQDEIHVLDLKTGKIPVEVHGNKQLLFYAVTAATLAPRAKGVHLHIVQPWAPSWDPADAHWFADTTVLAQFMDEALQAEARIQGGDLSFGPSDACLFCPANPHTRGDRGTPLCPAMMQLLYPQARVDEDAVLSL